MVRLHHNNKNNNSKVQLTGPKAGNPGSRQVGEVFRRKHQLQEGLGRRDEGTEWREGGGKLNKSNLNTLINYQLAACVPRGAN